MVSSLCAVPDQYTLHEAPIDRDTTVEKTVGKAKVDQPTGDGATV